MSVVIDGTSGITSPAETVQGALTTTGNTILGDASTDTLNVGNGGLVKDASGNVGIGTASPASKLHVSRTDATLIGLFNGTTKGVRFNIDSTLTTLEGVDNSGVASYQPLAFGGSELRFNSNGTSERMRIDSSGNVGIGTASPTATLHVNGTFKYNTSLTAGGGINILATYTYNNNSANTIGQVNAGFCIITINQGNSPTVIPVFLNAGGGVGWSGSMFDPDSGVFAYGSGPTVSFATVGTSANSYTLSMSGGGGAGTITRTAGAASYTVNVLVFIS